MAAVEVKLTFVTDRSQLQLCVSALYLFIKTIISENKDVKPLSLAIDLLKSA